MHYYISPNILSRPHVRTDCAPPAIQRGRSSGVTGKTSWWRATDHQGRLVGTGVRARVSTRGCWYPLVVARVGVPGGAIFLVQNHCVFLTF